VLERIQRNPASILSSRLRLCVLNYTKSVAQGSFLRSCLNLGLTPTGLTPKIPLSAITPIHRPFLIPLYRSFAVEVTLNMHSLHLQRACNRLTNIQSLTKILLLIPHDWLSKICTVWTQARYLHSSMDQKHLNKLSLICRRAFQIGCALYLALPHKKHQVTLHAEPPLPLPTTTIQPPNNNKPSALTTQSSEISDRPGNSTATSVVNLTQSEIITKGLIFPLQAV